MLFVATAAFATQQPPVIYSYSPDHIVVSSGEYFLHLQGTRFYLGVSTIVFSGPAGRFEMRPNAASEGAIDVWVPQAVVNTIGMYTVRVLVGPYNDGTPPQYSNAVSFEVTRNIAGETPTLDLPPTVVVEATGPAGATATFTVRAFSAIDPDVQVHCSRESGSNFTVGTTTVLCTATDHFGHSFTDAFLVRIVDTTRPQLSLPSDFTVEGDDNGKIVTFSATATDIVDGNVSVQCTPASGTRFKVGTTTVSCAAIDRHSNAAFGKFNVTVLGRPAPVLHMPDTMFVEATGPGGAKVEYTVTASDPYEGSVPVTCSPESGLIFTVGVTTVSCKASNSVKSSTGTFEVHVVDRTPPRLSLPADIRVVANRPGGATVTFSATALDVVEGNLSSSVICTPPSGSLFPMGTTLVNCSVHDSQGNAASGNFSVTVASDHETVMKLPDDITAEATSEQGAEVHYLVTAPPAYSVSCAPASGSHFPLGSTTVQCTATNTARTETGSFRVTVVDTTPPLLTLSSDISVAATSASGATVTFSATAHDTVDGNLTATCTPPSGSLFAVGTTTVNCSAHDAYGNNANGSFHVTVTAYDDTPVLTLPADITTKATSDAGAEVMYSVTARDGYTVSCTPPSGSLFAVGTTTVNCSAHDTHGNNASGSFHVTVTAHDDTPVLTLPADITTKATSEAGAEVTFSVSARDGYTVVCTPPSGSLFAIGTTTVNCSAHDAHGNNASGSFHVTVTALDTPVLTLPADITAEATSDAGAEVTYSVSARNGYTVACAPRSGSLFPFGRTTVQCTATNGTQTASGSFHITVVDTTPPALAGLSVSPSVLSPPNHQLVPVTVSVAVSDAGGGASARITTVLANEPINGSGDGNTEVDWQITGPLTANLRAERSGQSGERIYTLIIVATDAAGNQSMGSVEVRVTSGPSRVRGVAH
jgi:hypothetical protein